MVREDKAVSYKGKTDAADKPGDLAHGKSAIMTSVGKDDAIVSAAEAARRGWIEIVKPKLDLKGKQTAEQLVGLLNRIGSLYNRGGSSSVDVLDLVGLSLPNGGQLRLRLQDCPPEDMKQLAELFEVLAGLVSTTPASNAQIQIKDLNADCPFVKALQPKQSTQDDPTSGTE